MRIRHIILTSVVCPAVQYFPHDIKGAIVERRLLNIKFVFPFDFHESVHRDIIIKVTNEIQLCRLIYYS